MKPLPDVSICMNCRHPHPRVVAHGRYSFSVYCPNAGCESVPANGSTRRRAVTEWNKIQRHYGEAAK